MNAALRLWSLLTWDTEPEPELKPPLALPLELLLELPREPPPELLQEPPPELLQELPLERPLELEAPKWLMEREPETSLEVKSVMGKELGLGPRVPETPVAGPRRNRSASRKVRAGFILCCWPEQLDSAPSPGPSYSAPWGFPQGQFVGKEEATREHVTPRNLSHLHTLSLSPALSAAPWSGYLLPNINSNVLFQA